MTDIHAFDPAAKCSPKLTQCPRCKNVRRNCDGLGLHRVAAGEPPKPLCELGHLEALARVRELEAEIAILRRRVQAPSRRRARSLRRANDSPALTLPPLYHAIMGEIQRLMDIPEPAMTPPDEALLDTLVDVAMVYEQSHLPGWLFSTSDDAGPAV